MVKEYVVRQLHEDSAINRIIGSLQKKTTYRRNLDVDGTYERVTSSGTKKLRKSTTRESVQSAFLYRSSSKENEIWCQRAMRRRRRERYRKRKNGCHTKPYPGVRVNEEREEGKRGRRGSGDDALYE